MSLDVHIIYKKPKKVNYNKTHAACGSTMAMVADDYEVEEKEWHANITHNMGIMARHVPTSYKRDGEEYSISLYDAIWNPDEFNMANTDYVGQAIIHGLSFMFNNAEELEKYNPDNGWGDFGSFILWLVKYWEACRVNPDCKITLSK